MKYENSHGKSESWYIVDVDELAKQKSIKKGLFFNLEAGTCMETDVASSMK